MKKKILLVEDETLIAMDEAQTLQKYGYEVVTAYKGEKALEIVEEDPEVSLILMDIDLGKGIDGTEAAQKILEHHELPIVFLSSHTEPEIVEKTEGITSYGYIVKNSGETVLSASIRMAFRLFEAKMLEKKHKDALIHSHKLMSYIIEHNQSAIAVHDKDLNYIYVSKQYLNQYNVRERDVIGRHHYEVFPDLPQKWRDVHQRALMGEVSRGETDPYEREDGTTDWTRWECRPWYESDESIGGIIIYTEVISKERRINRDVRDNINYVQSILRTTKDGFWVLDLDEKFIDVNSAYCRMSGYTRDEILERRIPDIDADENLEETEERFKRILSTGHEVFEARHRRKDGSIFNVEISASILGGDEDRVICFCRDITERKKAEKELAEREEKLRITLDSIGDAVITTDLDGNVIRMNPVAEKLTGWTVDTAKGKKLQEVFRITKADTREVLDNPVEKVIKTGEVVGLANHTVLLSKDGHEYQIADSAAPIKDKDQNIEGVVLVFRDVSEKYEREKQITENERKYRGLFNSIRDAILVTDTDRNIIDCNSAFSDVFGYSLEDIRGKKTVSVYKNEDEYTQMGKALREYKGDQANFLFTVNYKRKDGTIFPGETNVFYLRDDEGKVTGFIGLIRDITDRKKSEKSIEKNKIFLDTVLDNIKEAIIICNEEGKIVRLNESARRLHNLPEKQFPAEKWAEYYDLYYPDGETLLATEDIPLFRALNGEDVINAEIMVTPKGGSSHLLSCNGHQLINNEGKIAGAVIAMHDITEYREIEKSLRNALEEKDFLMGELNHRVKNNLALVSSLIYLKDSETDEDLSELMHRIDVIKLIHEKLSQQNDLDQIDVKEYLQELLESIFSSAYKGDVDIVNNIEEVSIPTKTAIPLALITNEIATNAIKHGFTSDKEARFTIAMTRDSANTQYVLTLSNTGHPFPEDIGVEHPETMGLQLLSTLADQINGTIELKKEPYPIFTIRFPLQNE
ncbi:MAG: PAS domain S-box protein [Spirochaetales bacterium]|nr:PAS domain S-box protein [Spirochaetales bacterium]MCF7938785.1 PAS domain S-box protein [Spirochaetales bacterium]